LQTFKHIACSRTVARFLLPATLHEIPNIVREPTPIRPLRPLGALALYEAQNSSVLGTTVEGHVPGKNLVNRHPESVTIRPLRPTAPLQPEHDRVKKFRAHPANSARSSARSCGCRVREGEETEIRDPGVTVPIDQDVTLTEKDCCQLGRHPYFPTPTPFKSP